MAFHIKNLPDNHDIWKMVEATAFECTWSKDIDEDDYVSAVGACSDFLYGLSDAGRMQLEGTPVHIVGSIKAIITNDKFVRELVNKAASSYTYYTMEQFEDVDMNALIVSKVYRTLIEAGNIAFYEQQSYIETTEKIKL